MGSVAESTDSHSPGPMVKAFLVVLPDGSVSLFERPRMTAGDVLSHFPNHSLSLTPSQPRQLLPDTELLPHNTYYLHPPHGSLASTQRSATSPDADVDSGTLPPGSAATRLRKRHGLSDQFPLEGSCNLDQPLGTDEEDPSTDLLVKRSTFPGPMPLPPISQSFTRQQSQPRSYLPPDLQMNTQNHKLPLNSAFFIHEEDVSADLGAPVIPKSRSCNEEKQQPHTMHMSREQYRASLLNRPTSADEFDFPLILGYTGEPEQTNTQGLTMNAPRGSRIDPMFASQSFARLPPLPLQPTPPQDRSAPKIPSQSMRMSREQYRAMLARKSTTEFEFPGALGEAGSSQAPATGLAELQNFRLPGQYSQAFGRLHTITAASTSEDQLLSSLAPAGPTRSQDRARSKSREEIVLELKEHLRMQRSTTMSSGTREPAQGAKSHRSTNSILAELEEMEATDSPRTPGRKEGRNLSTLSLPLQCPSPAELSFREHLQQQEKVEKEKETAKDEKKISRTSKGGALFSKLTAKFAKNKSSKASKTVDVDQQMSAGSHGATSGLGGAEINAKRAILGQTNRGIGKESQDSWNSVAVPHSFAGIGSRASRPMVV